MPITSDKPPPSSSYSLACAPGESFGTGAYSEDCFPDCQPGHRRVGADCYPIPAGSPGALPGAPAGAGTLGQEAAAYAVGGKIEPPPPTWTVLVEEEEETTTSTGPAAATKAFPWHLVILVALGAAVAARLK